VRVKTGFRSVVYCSVKGNKVQIQDGVEPRLILHALVRKIPALARHSHSTVRKTWNTVQIPILTFFLKQKVQDGGSIVSIIPASALQALSIGQKRATVGSIFKYLFKTLLTNEII
jgi:hypothetical protein